MAGSFRDLTVFKKAFSLAMEVFDITKLFPSEEKYALTDQLRRSSRSVCRAIGEGYRKRQYPKHFSSKMSDADKIPKRRYHLILLWPVTIYQMKNIMTLLENLKRSAEC
jgi:four helix bundle protein|tara:strand:- start:483 stop:809 length:327 start_codon:yes stop_codon:yes gene_type:complete